MNFKKIFLYLLILPLMYSCEVINEDERLIEVELARVQKALKRDIAPVALEDPGLGLQRPDDAPYLFQFVRTDKGGFVDKNGIAEFYLFYQQPFNIVIFKVLLLKAFSTFKFSAQA